MGDLVFGDPEFFSTSQLRDYVHNGRKLLRPMYHELHVASEELIAALSHVPSTNPHVFGLDSKLRARIVGAHLRRSADAIEVAASSMVKTYMSFRKHYVEELRGAPRRPRRQFQFDE